MSRCANITEDEKAIYAEMARLKIDGHDLRARLMRHPGGDRAPLVIGPLAIIYARHPEDKTWHSIAVSHGGKPYIYLCRFSEEIVR